MTTSADQSSLERSRSSVIGIAVAAVIVLGIGLAIGWWRSSTSAVPMVGTELPGGIPAPQLLLNDTDGEQVDLADRFPGKVTLLYLGYLNCPDACPITMDVLSRALSTRSSAVRDSVQVVFVTTDPERDTPDDIRRYLDRFDQSFTGLTTSAETLEQLQAALLAPSALKEAEDENGDYLVGHTTAVYVFDADGVARFRYPFGTRQADWERIIEDHVDA